MGRRGWLFGWLLGFAGAGEQVIGERPEWTEERRMWLEHPPAGRACAVYRNGLRQMRGQDYEISGHEIVVVGEWDQAADLVMVDYWW